MRILASSSLVLALSLAIAPPVQGFSIGDFFAQSDFSLSAFLGLAGEAEAEDNGMPESFTVPPASAQPYGVDGTVTEAELITLFHLQFPQNYASVKDRLGFPAKHDQNADYYQIEGTPRWVLIWYDGDQATGYVIGE